MTALNAHGVNDVDVLTHRDINAVASPIHSAHMVHFEQDTGDPSRCHVLRGTSRIPLAAFLAEHDIVVNCVLQNTGAPLIFVATGELGSFAPGSLIVDVSCDEGMGFAWARPTSSPSPWSRSAITFTTTPSTTARRTCGTPPPGRFAEALLPHLRPVLTGPVKTVGRERDDPAGHRNPRRGHPQSAHPFVPAPFTGLPAPPKSARTPSRPRPALTSQQITHGAIPRQPCGVVRWTSPWCSAVRPAVLREAWQAS